MLNKGVVFRGCFLSGFFSVYFSYLTWLNSPFLSRQLYIRVGLGVLFLIKLFTHYYYFGSIFKTPYHLHGRPGTDLSDQDIKVYQPGVIMDHLFGQFINPNTSHSRAMETIPKRLRTPLLERSFFFILAPIGIAYLMLRGRFPFLLPCIMGGILALMIYGMHPGTAPGCLQFHSLHYFKMWYPFLAIMSLVGLVQIGDYLDALGKEKVMGDEKRTEPIAFNNWYYLACVYNGSSIEIYKNGSLSKSTSAPFQINTNSHDISIGARKPSEISPYRLFFRGIMEETRFSNQARTQTEIHTYYKRYRQTKPNGLYPYYLWGTITFCAMAILFINNRLKRWLNL